MLLTFVLQVFDATNTTRERRASILSFAKEKGYKASTGVGVAQEIYTCILLTVRSEDWFQQLHISLFE